MECFLTELKYPERIRFADFEFDGLSGDLRRDGISLKLQPQPAKVLAVLIRRSGQVVSRQELAEEVWGSGTFVDFEQGLNYAIRHIRTVLGDDAEQPRFLEALPSEATGSLPRSKISHRKMMLTRRHACRRRRRPSRREDCDLCSVSRASHG